MSETENLILCIESHPCLWDTSNEDYHDKEKKISAWLEICNMLTQDWDTLTEDERRSKSQELKKKWNNCRDYYKKNKQKRGRRSRYVYADILSFLDKADKKNHEENDDTADYLELEVLETTEDDDDEEWETQKAVEDIKNEFKHKNTNRQPAPKKRKLQHVPDEISNVTSKNYTASKDNDDDKNFLLSFSSDMKRMTHRQKIEFKLAMMQLLKDTFTENANSPPYYRDASMSEPPKLIYSDPVMYQEDAKSSLAQSRFRLTPSTDQRHSKQRKN